MSKKISNISVKILVGRIHEWADRRAAKAMDEYHERPASSVVISPEILSKYKITCTFRLHEGGSIGFDLHPTASVARLKKDMALKVPHRPRRADFRTPLSRTTIWCLESDLPIVKKAIAIVENGILSGDSARCADEIAKILEANESKAGK
jgi:hypothetical protein